LLGEFWKICFPSGDGGTAGGEVRGKKEKNGSFFFLLFPSFSLSPTVNDLFLYVFYLVMVEKQEEK
jgi:hypothetical protein